MLAQNSHNHLLLAVWVLWLHFQLLHVAVADLGPLPGTLTLGPCGRARPAGLLSRQGSLLSQPPEVPGTPTPPGCRMPRGYLGSLGRDSTATGGPRGTLTVHSRGAQRQEQQEQGSRQEPHAGRRGAVGSGDKRRAPARLVGVEHASPLGSLLLRPSKGAPDRLPPCCAALWRWVPRSPHSLPPPTPASFKFAPALSESELINMQNQSVTH